MRLVLTILFAGLVSVAGVLVGLWWAPFVVGLVVGAAHPRARIAVAVAGAVGLVAWLIPLAAIDRTYGLGPSAQSIAAIMGFGHQVAVPVTLTLVVGLLLGLTGAWLGSAGRRLAVR